MPAPGAFTGAVGALLPARPWPWSELASDLVLVAKMAEGAPGGPCIFGLAGGSGTTVTGTTTVCVGMIGPVIVMVLPP